MRRLPFVIVSLALSGAAYADEPTAQARVGQVLTQARESGALARVLEPAHFFFRKDMDQGAVVRFDGQWLGDPAEPQGVQLRMALFGLTGRLAGRELQTSFDLGFDGAVRRFEVFQAHKRQGGAAEGVVQGPYVDLTTRVSGAGGVTKRQLGWSQDAIPFVVCLFLARLHDQGLPDALRFRMFEAEDLRLNDYPSSLTRAADDTHLRVTCRKHAEQESQAYVFVFEAAPPQTLLKIEVARIGVMDPIDEAEAARLLGARQDQPLAPEDGSPVEPAPTPEQPQPQPSESDGD